MDPSIRRILPEAAIQSGATRRVGPRRERGSREEPGFADELARETGDRARYEAGAEPDDQPEHPVALPSEGEVGTRIDLLG